MNQQEELMFIGSSPRVRGTSVYRDSEQGRVPVHPRVCGEQSVLHLNRLPDTGSSPRVRGTVLPRTGHILLPRFIPACAGNSTGTMNTRFTYAVHPRVCGEQFKTREP